MHPPREAAAPAPAGARRAVECSRRGARAGSRRARRAFAVALLALRSRSPRAPPQTPRADAAAPGERSARGRGAAVPGPQRAAARPSREVDRRRADDAPRGQRQGARGRHRRRARGVIAHSPASAPTRCCASSRKDVGAEWVVRAASPSWPAATASTCASRRPTSRAPTRTLVFTAKGEPELLDRVGELADRVIEIAAAARRPGPDRGGALRGRPRSSPLECRARCARSPASPTRPTPRGPRARCARCPASAPRRRDRARPDGVIVVFRARAGRAPGPGGTRREAGGAHRRDAGARQPPHRGRRDPRAHRDQAGRAASTPAQVAEDVREIHALGFFRDVRVLLRATPKRPHPDLRGRGEPGRAPGHDRRQREHRRRQDPRRADAHHRRHARLPAALREPRAHRGPLPRRGLLPGDGRLRDRGRCRTTPSR